MGSRNSLRVTALLVVLGTGCTTVRTTDPSRTATEQFLLSVATTNAVEQLALDAARGRSVFLDSTNVTVVDHSFVIAEVRAHLLMSGARLVEKRENAEIVVEMRSGGSGIDRYEFLLGIPALPIGTMADAAGQPSVPVTTPELALVKRVRQWGFTSVGLVAYWRDTGELIDSSGPFVGRSRREDWWFFGSGPKSNSDIPPAEPLQE